MEQDSRDGGDFTQSAQQLMPDCFFFDIWRHVIVLFCMRRIYQSGLRGEPHQKETAVQSLVFWQRKRRLNWHTKWNTRVKMSMSAFGMLADISKKKQERNKAAS